MPLYTWTSTYLRNYRSGHLIAMADSVEAARAKLRAEFDVFDRERYHWLYLDPLDDDDKAEIAHHRAAFEADIAKEPTTAPVLFLVGSD